MLGYFAAEFQIPLGTHDYHNLVFHALTHISYVNATYPTY